jgi:outer membrane protein OmpA-like peptidoglycan-associated protein
MSDPSRGGLSGFVQKLRSAGVGSTVDGWIARPGDVAELDGPTVERTLGGDAVSSMTSKLGLDRGTIMKALGFAIPSLVARLAKGGNLPSALPAEAESFIGNRSAWFAGAVPTVRASAAAAAPSRNWLPWALGALVVALGLGYCASHRTSARVATAPPTVAAPAPASVEEPVGAAVIAGTVNDMPSLKVYFDTGKTDVAVEFSDKSKGLVEYLKTTPAAIAVISGFNDPTGDPVANEELSKNRARAVQAALTAAGVATDKTALEKPADATGTGATNAASRRVDVVMRK